METNFSSDADFSSALGAAILSIEMILALIANGIVLLITITQRKSWKQSATILFTSLILAHLLLALDTPFFIIALASGEWIFGSTDEEKRGTCLFANFIFWYIVLVISMTVAAISFDRFLFIVKPHLHKRFMRPWVALTLTIIIWILAVPLSIVGFFETSNSFGFFIYVILLLVTIVGIILVTSVWTFCFTCRFINNQSVTAGESVYASRKKRLFGIFGSMLIVYLICFFPAFLNLIFFLLNVLLVEFVIVASVCFLFITVANPIVQAYFRPEIKSVLLSRCPLLSTCVCCSCSHTVC